MSDRIQTTESTAVNRRQFLTVAAVTAAAVSLPVLQPPAASAARAKPVPPDKPVDCGPLADFAKDGVTAKWATTPASFFLVRANGKLVATSSICTHKFCPVTVQDDEFFCKCHKSHFTLAGEATEGPATRSGSLPRYAIKVDDKQHVIVEPAKEFTEKKWDDAASFVAVDAKG